MLNKCCENRHFVHLLLHSLFSFPVCLFLNFDNLLSLYFPTTYLFVSWLSKYFFHFCLPFNFTTSVWRLIACSFASWFLFIDCIYITLFSTLAQTHCASHVWVHAGLFECFHNPPNLDVDYRIVNVRMWSFCMRMHTGDLGFIVSLEGLLWFFPRVYFSFASFYFVVIIYVVRAVNWNPRHFVTKRQTLERGRKY